MVDVDARGFTRELLAVADLVEDRSTDIIRKACIDLYRRIVELTPVDTGRAKGSWALSTTDDVEYETAEGEYSAADIVGIINDQVTEFTAEIIRGEVVIYNNLDYIDTLENGHSQQAPAGMVAVSLAEFEKFFNRAVSRLGGEIT